MFRSSIISISRSAHANNLAFLQERLQGARLMSVVKGNAYGHGIRQFVPMAMEAGVEHFGVYSADEACELLEGVDRRPDVFIMGHVEGDALAWAVENGVECNVYDLDRLDALIALAQRMGKKARIHVEVETGMHRTGFTEEDQPALVERLLQHRDRLELVGLFTHFAGAESQVNDGRVRSQIGRYARARERFDAAGLKATYHHQACSAAMMNFPGTIGPLARVGIMQYGFWPNPETWFRYSQSTGTTEDPLRRLIRWSSRVMAITRVKAGGFIGYGTSCEAARDMRVAVVPVGYAHGFDRGLSNVGRVLIRGQLARVTGIVNMNAISVDVTDIQGAEKGDEVVLIGSQGDHHISVASFSELSEQLNYQLLTRLPADIPRVLVP